MADALQMLVPRALPGLTPLAIDLTEVIRAESRIHEIATLSAGKAPELLAAFNLAYIEASRAIALLEQELSQAKRRCDQVRAMVILDRVPRVLAERGLASSKSPMGSEDLRRAVLDMDPDYQQAAQLVADIDGSVEVVRSKLRGIEMAYNSVKKLLSDQTFSFIGSLSAGNEGNATIGQVVNGFGKAKY